MPPAAGGAAVDLRSDTVTLPSPGMRRAIAEAEVGDDVYGEDPTVRRLQERAAALVGHEAALFVPSGCMGNQIAIQLHAPRGTDVIVEATSHVYLYELGAMAAQAGAFPRVVAGERGVLTPAAIEAVIAPEEYDLARASLLLVENSHNHAGGTVTGLARLAELRALTRRLGIRLHIDGARLFNAATTLGVPVAEIAAHADSVMFCLSKGLGAPVGSVLCGPAAFVDEARVVRKRLGGGMRQVGILAAAGLYALDHNVERLADDHRRARRLAEALAGVPGFELDPALVETNIVIAALEPPARQAEVLANLAREGVLASAMGPGRVRFVTHLGIDDAALERVLGVLRRF